MKKVVKTFFSKDTKFILTASRFSCRGASNKPLFDRSGHVGNLTYKV